MENKNEIIRQKGASWIKRLAAFLVDYLIVSIVAGIFAGIIWSVSGMTPDRVLNEGMQLCFLLLALGLFLYGALMEQGRWHATIGKRMFGLEIVSVKNAEIRKLDVWYRNADKVLLLLLAGIIPIQTLSGILSWIWAITLIVGLCLKDHRAIHDRLAGVMVVDRNDVLAPADEKEAPAEVKENQKEEASQEEGAEGEEEDFSRTMPGMRQLNPKKLYLVGVKGQYQGMELELTEEMVLGRDSSCCNLIFNEKTPGISRVHCKITPLGEYALLEDMESSYGTFLENGQRLKAHAPMNVQNGEIFRIGEGDEMQIIRR